MPILLLIGAVTVVTIALLMLFWRYMDRRVQTAYSDHTLDELAKRLDEASTEQQHLTGRIESLEAIIAAEPWGRTLGAPDRLRELETRQGEL